MMFEQGADFILQILPLLSLWKPIFGPFFVQKSAFFSLHSYNPLFFGLRRTQLNGIITSPYPEATLDTFGFPVGAHLAARRAVLGP